MDPIGTLDAPVTRIEELGGSVVRRPEPEYGDRFVVVADPEGNEFCVIRRLDRRSRLAILNARYGWRERHHRTPGPGP